MVPVEDESPEPSREKHLQNLIRDCTRYLQKLKERQARQGLETPPGVLLEIEDVAAELANLQAELNDLKEAKKLLVEIPEEELSDGLKEVRKETEPLSRDELETGAEPEAPPWSRLLSSAKK